VATASAFGSGVVGGVFTPTLFIGAAIGVLYGQMILLVAPGLRADPAMYGFVGMGSFIAATTGAPLMAILMAFELTLDYSITPYLMVNCVVAYYCSGIFEKRFMYGESLERKGAAFFNQQLAQVNLQDLVRLDPITLPKNATFAQIAETFVQHRYQHIYVVDHENRLLGAISLHDVKSFLDRPELESVVIAADIMDEDFPRVTTGQGMNEALHQFSAARSERLPVVDSLHSKRLIGSISKTDIILHLAGEQAGTGTNRSF
jgi:chloride channel protein, CIC family